MPRTDQPPAPRVPERGLERVPERGLERGLVRVPERGLALERTVAERALRAQELAPPLSY